MKRRNEMHGEEQSAAAPTHPGQGAIRVTGRCDAPASRVFDAWLDPGIAGKWLFATAARPIAHVEIAPRKRGCELTLTHECVPQERAADLEGRWTGILYGLGMMLDSAPLAPHPVQE
jgi:hypothetical protein